MTSLSFWWRWWAATASAACVARLGAVADWWRSWPMTNTFACLCSRQWWTFWTYLVTVSLFSLYLMNFDSLHAWCRGNILTMHYKSMKYDVSLSQGSVSTLFRWGEHVFHVCVKMFFLLTALQILLKNQTTFSRVMIINVLPRLFYESQCIYFSRREGCEVLRSACLCVSLWICLSARSHNLTRNSSGDEIANVNFLRRHRIGTYTYTFTHCAPEATEFGEITQHKSYYAVQGHSRSPILVQIESSYTTSRVVALDYY